MDSFFSLIDELNDCRPDERPSIERRIRRTFEIHRAVLALDMSGYSFSVQRDGIVSHLCKIRRMQKITMPIIESIGGEVVRQLADNILAVFEEPAAAIQSAIAINGAVRDAQIQNDDQILTVAIGIDYGPLLLVPGYDCFGDPVNIAYKLGEDVAHGGEILITENARQRLAPDNRFSLQAITLSISGLEVRAHRVLY